MSIYQQLLNFYLDSERYFKVYIYWFFELYGHLGECKYHNKEYLFESELFHCLQQTEKVAGGFELNLDDRLICKYYTKNYSNTQLFAIVFAHWCGIKKEQILRIADKHTEKYAWDLLNYYLCNPTVITPSMSKNELRRHRYEGRYFLFDKNDEGGIIALVKRSDINERLIHQLNDWGEDL